MTADLFLSTSNLPIMIGLQRAIASNRFGRIQSSSIFRCRSNSNVIKDSHFLSKLCSHSLSTKDNLEGGKIKKLTISSLNERKKARQAISLPFHKDIHSCRHR